MPARSECIRMSGAAKEGWLAERCIRVSELGARAMLETALFHGLVSGRGGGIPIGAVKSFPGSCEPKRRG
jgi:hypothetical protein